MKSRTAVARHKTRSPGLARHDRVAGSVARQKPPCVRRFSAVATKKDSASSRTRARTPQGPVVTGSRAGAGTFPRRASGGRGKKKRQGERDAPACELRCVHSRRSPVAHAIEPQESERPITRGKGRALPDTEEKKKEIARHAAHSRSTPRPHKTPTDERDPRDPIGEFFVCAPHEFPWAPFYSQNKRRHNSATVRTATTTCHMSM
jgi:hypothetical protein